MPLMIYWQALGEALALCRSLNLDPERLMDMLSETSGAATVLKVRGAGHRRDAQGRRRRPGDLQRRRRDQGYCAPCWRKANGRASSCRSCEKTLACYEEAQRKVTGDAEVSAVSVYWANRAKS